MVLQRKPAELFFVDSMKLDHRLDLGCLPYPGDRKRCCWTSSCHCHLEFVDRAPVQFGLQLSRLLSKFLATTSFASAVKKLWILTALEHSDCRLFNSETAEAYPGATRVTRRYDLRYIEDEAPKSCSEEIQVGCLARFSYPSLVCQLPACCWLGQTEGRCWSCVWCCWCEECHCLIAPGWVNFHLALIQIAETLDMNSHRA